MGFTGEIIEKSLMYGNVQSVEEAMYYLIPDKYGSMEHEFILDQANVQE